MLFCDRCIQKLCKSEHYASNELRERVNSVYTALNQRSGELSSAERLNNS
jgi:hypothetical protein